MGGFHLVAEVATRDVAKIMETNRVHPEVQREVNTTMQKLLRVAHKTTEVIRRNVHSEGHLICRDIVDSLVEQFCNVDIPLKLVEESEKKCAQLQQELLEDRQIIAHLKESHEKMERDYVKAASAREYLMNCYFHEVLQLRKQLAQYQEGIDPLVTPTPKNTDSLVERSLSPSKNKNLKMPLAVLTASSSGNIASTDVTNAVFDYSKYIHLTDSNFVPWPDRYARLERESQEIIARINAENAAQTAEHERIMVLKDALIAQKECTIRDLEQLTSNLEPSIRKVMRALSFNLRTQLARMREGIMIFREQVTDMFATLSQHINATDARVEVFVRFVHYCAQRITQTVGSTLSGNTTANAKPLWQFFLLTGGADPDVEAKSFWQEHQTTNEVITTFKNVLNLIKDMSPKMKKPNPVAVELYMDMNTMDEAEPTSPTKGDPSGPQTPLKKGANTPTKSGAVAALKKVKSAAALTTTLSAQKDRKNSDTPALNAPGDLMKQLLLNPTPATLKKFVDTCAYMAQKCLQLIIQRVVYRCRRKAILKNLPTWIRNIVLSILRLDQDILSAGQELENIRYKMIGVNTQIRVLSGMLGKSAAAAKSEGYAIRRGSSVADLSAEAEKRRRSSVSINPVAGEVPKQGSGIKRLMPRRSLTSPLTQRGSLTQHIGGGLSDSITFDEAEEEDEEVLVPAPSREVVQGKMFSMLESLQMHQQKLKEEEYVPPPKPSPPLPLPAVVDIPMATMTARASSTSPVQTEPPPPPVIVGPLAAHVHGLQTTVAGTAPMLVQSTSKALEDKSHDVYVHAQANRNDNIRQLDEVTSTIVAAAEVRSNSLLVTSTRITLPSTIPTSIHRMPVPPVDKKKTNSSRKDA